jgi:hypothetical protein
MQSGNIIEHNALNGKEHGHRKFTASWTPIGPCVASTGSPTIARSRTGS